MKALKILCGILAGFLSAVLVVMLILSPILMSVLDILKPETITNAFTSVIAGGTASAKEEMTPVYVGEEDVQLSLLADGDTTGQSANNNAILSLITPEMVQDMLGVEVETEALENILKSEAATDTINDILGAYTEGLTDAITGKGEAAFTAETVKKIANDNLDKIVDVLQKEVPVMAEKPKEELKTEIKTAIENNAENIAAALPKAEDIKENLMNSLDAATQQAIAAGLWCISNKVMINWVFFGVCAVLCVLIFFLRFWGFKGLRQLAIDMFVGGGIGVVLSVILKLAGAKIPELMEGEAEMAAKAVVTVINEMGSAMLWRTILIVVVGGVSLAGFIVLKKLRNKKAALEEMAEELVALEEETAVVEEVATVEEA